MSKKSNPTVIGAFVVGATVLLAVGVAIFGGAELLAKRDIYVAYFVESAQGLRQGSNVMLNGVRIGFVSGMALIVDQDTFESKTEVTMEILPDSYIVTSNDATIGRGLGTAESFQRAIFEGGLRAELEVESFVTGQLLVEIVNRPDTEPVLRGGDNPPYPEIPTIQSEIQEMLAKVRTLIGDISEGFDARELGQRIQSVLQGMDELVNSEDLRETLAGINRITNREETQELTATLQATLNELRSAAGDAGSLIRNADTKLDTVELKLISERLVAVMDETQATLAAARFQLQGESIEVHQLGTTLREVEGAARALREFLDYLERNPEAILRGKQQ